MAKRINEKVISKNVRGKKTESNKEVNNTNIFTYINKFKYYIIGILLILFIVLGFVFFKNDDNKVLTINNDVIKNSDFNIYLYSAKYNYFGKNLSNITEDDLDVIYDDESKTTVRDYLKQVALNDIKTAAAIRKLASDNNIELDESDKETLLKEKNDFIKSLGGKEKYKDFLKKNNTLDKSYEKMSESDKLYKKIIKKLYSEDKVNDLTDEEKENANNNYSSHYYKVKQIILTTIDVSSGKSLNSITINQKEALANTILSMANSGEEFDTLIRKYSEDSIDEEGPFDSYYKVGELLPELEEEVKKLAPNQVSKVIKTKYAFHIIQRLELDNSKLEDYYDELREDKCINDLKDKLDNLKVVYHDAYEKIKIK